MINKWLFSSILWWCGTKGTLCLIGLRTQGRIDTIRVVDNTVIKISLPTKNVGTMMMKQVLANAT